MELPVHVIQGPRGAVVGDRRAAFASPYNALQGERARQPLDRATRNRDVLAVELPPDLGRTVDFEVLVVDTLDLQRQLAIAKQPRRDLRRVGLAGLALVVHRRGDRQLLQIDSTP